MNINRKKIFVYVLVFISILYILGIGYATKVNAALVNSEVDTGVVEKDDHFVIEDKVEETKQDEVILSQEQESANTNPNAENKTVKETNIMNKSSKKNTKDKKENKSKENSTNKQLNGQKETKTKETVSVVSELDTIKNTKDKLGSMGRLYIPSVHLNVGVYHANVLGDENYNAQTIVDRKDSAAYYKLGNQYIIADHNYQGFNKLISVASGAKAYIKKSDGTVAVYKLKRKFEGRNTSADLTDAKGTSIQDMEAGLVMYTCYKSEKIIMVTLWELC